MDGDCAQHDALRLDITGSGRAGESQIGFDVVSVEFLNMRCIV